MLESQSTKTVLKGSLLSFHDILLKDIWNNGQNLTLYAFMSLMQLQEHDKRYSFLKFFKFNYKKFFARGNMKFMVSNKFYSYR